MNCGPTEKDGCERSGSFPRFSGFPVQLSNYGAPAVCDSSKHVPGQQHQRFVGHRCSVEMKGMELQVHDIKDRLRDEAHAIPKAKKLIEAALRQQKKLESVSACIPSYIPERITGINTDTSKCMQPEISQLDHGIESLKLEEPAPKEKKGRAPPPMWYITGDELNSLSSYMKQRLTLDKVNAAIGDMVSYAEANAQLITAPRKKLTENNLDRALELRDIAMVDAVKGKHFFLESDVKGPAMKLDNTGKAILTVLRHLGRISETRVGHHRVIILLRPQ